MVNNTEQQLSSIFSALADPTRRAIIQRMTEGDITVTQLAQPFDMSLPAVSKHLKVLEAAGLLQREKEGRNYNCRLLAGPLREAMEWIRFYRPFWESRLDGLENFLALEDEKQTDRNGDSK